MKLSFQILGTIPKVRDFWSSHITVPTTIDIILSTNFLYDKCNGPMGEKLVRERGAGISSPIFLEF
jgi:hypothetical protein